MFGFGKAAEIACFGNECQGGMRAHPDEAGELLDVFGIALPLGKFFDTCIEALDLVGELVQGDEVLIEDFAQEIIERKRFEPSKMPLRPIRSALGEVQIVAHAERLDLLLDLLEGDLVVIAHADEILDGGVLLGGDMDGAEGTKGKTAGNLHGVAPISFDLVTMEGGHGGGCENGAGNAVLLELVVEGEAEGAGFVAAEEFTGAAKIALYLLQVR